VAGDTNGVEAETSVTPPEDECADPGNRFRSLCPGRIRWRKRHANRGKAQCDRGPSNTPTDRDGPQQIVGFSEVLRESGTPT